VPGVGVVDAGAGVPGWTDPDDPPPHAASVTTAAATDSAQSSERA
jgi:hypothetical protein